MGGGGGGGKILRVVVVVVVVILGYSDLDLDLVTKLKFIFLQNLPGLSILGGFGLVRLRYLTGSTSRSIYSAVNKRPVFRTILVGP